MSKTATPRLLTILMGLTLAGPALAQGAPPDVRDLVGARAAGGETALISRGYANVRTQEGDDRKWTYWWSAQRRACLSVTTMNGRFDSITATPAPDCQARPATLPGPVAGPVVNGRTEVIRFDRGASSANRRGMIRGYETMTYLLDVRAGQAMTVALQTQSRSAYFNITAPGAREALFNGSVNGTRYRGRVPSSGRYKIDVYLMRNAARRGEAARYALDVGVSR